METLSPAPLARQSALLRWLFWAPASALVLASSAIVGALVLFLLPLAGLFYAIFSWIAWRGPDSEEVE
jgi:hypothetical protein